MDPLGDTLSLPRGGEMITGHVFIATSLDGFIAREDHRLDWLMKQHTEGEDHGYRVFIESVDGIVMGRGSYENVLTFGEWPYTKPVVVMSRTLSQAAVPADLDGRVEVTALDPPELMQRLEQGGWSRAYVDGGRVVRSFIRCGLIEEIALTTVPILIGGGIRLFGGLAQDIDLELVDSRSFRSGMVQTRYRIKPAG